MSVNTDGKKVKPMRFASYKETIENLIKNNKKVHGLCKFNTISRL